MIFIMNSILRSIWPVGRQRGISYYPFVVNNSEYTMKSPGRHTRTVITPAKLPAQQRQSLFEELYHVHNAIFIGEDLATFTRSLAPANAIHTRILLHRDKRNRLVGYCAVHLFRHQGTQTRISVIRAQAGLHEAFRGHNSIVAFFIGCVLRYWLSNPFRPMVFVEAMIHPSSFLLMHKYGHAIWPGPESDPGHPLARIARELLPTLGYRPVSQGCPIVVDTGASIRETPAARRRWQHNDKASVRYFLANNPGYPQGHGLLALATVSPSAFVHSLARYVHFRLARRLAAPH